MKLHRILKYEEHKKCWHESNRWRGPTNATVTYFIFAIYSTTPGTFTNLQLWKGGIEAVCCGLQADT